MPDLQYPPRIHWLCRGNEIVTEAEKSQLIAECHRQMQTLLQAMRFQKLQQSTSKTIIGKWIFECSSIHGINSVVVRMAKWAGGGEEVLIVCWCNCQVTHGKILECIPCVEIVYAVHWTPDNCIPRLSDNYPGCAIGDPELYEGTRYIVNVCHKAGDRSFFIKFNCVPTDFETYEVGEHVSVLYIGDEVSGIPWVWDLAACDDIHFACKSAVRKFKQYDIRDDCIDAKYVILPYNYKSVLG